MYPHAVINLLFFSTQWQEVVQISAGPLKKRASGRCWQRWVWWSWETSVSTFIVNSRTNEAPQSCESQLSVCSWTGLLVQHRQVHSGRPEQPEDVGPEDARPAGAELDVSGWVSLTGVCSDCTYMFIHVVHRGRKKGHLPVKLCQTHHFV